METVKGNHRLGEAGTDNLVHAVGEVKPHLFNLQAYYFRYLLLDACNFLIRTKNITLLVYAHTWLYR